MKSTLTLSIVIPVYNEERYIKRCLDAIAAQTIKPLEVIVVDNNSTDKTVEIAKTYPFVTVLHEKRQHQVFAQARGFGYSKADILGRIDADCILPPNWVEAMLEPFSQPGIVAVVGSPAPYDVPLKRIGVAIWRFYQNDLTYWFSHKRMLWNSSSAIRASAWQIVKNQMAMADNLWEDHEMSYWLANLGQVKILKNLKVACSFRSVHKGLFTQAAYLYQAVRVFGLHNSKPKTVFFFMAWFTMAPVFILAMIDKVLLAIKNRH